VELHHVVEGSGPPLLLLHGFPQTHVCWDAVAELLRADFTVVRPDLPGYGDSAAAAADVSKHAMAGDVLALMRGLGHERFAVAGHDRGGLVGQRLALEHPAAVSYLAILDVVPVLDMWEFLGADAARAADHLFFLAQQSDLAERLLAGAPEAFGDSFLDGWCAVDGAISSDARAAYHRAFARPEGIRGVWRTTAPKRPWTSSTTAPTAPPGCASPPRFSCYGKSRGAHGRPLTRSPCGGAGRVTSPATASIADTSSLRSGRTRSPPRSASWPAGAEATASLQVVPIRT